MKSITINRFKKKSCEWIADLRKDQLNPYSEDKKLSNNTIEQYERSLNKFIKYLEENNINQINKSVVLKYRKYLIDNFKPSTVNVRIVSLNKFFYNHDLNDLSVKQVENTQKFSLNEIMTEEELQKFFKGCDDLNKRRLALLVDTLVSTGIRIEELKYFTPDNVNSDDNFFSVENKGKKRSVYITDTLKKKLLDYCKEEAIKDDEVIFHGRDKHKLLDKSTIWRELKQVADYAGINKKFSCHGFRHMFAKRMINNGMVIERLADILGHCSTETTRIYIRDDDKGNLNEINRILNQYA